MFVVQYNYRLPPDKTREYIVLEQQAIQIYLEHGCLGVEIYRDTRDPRLWMEINKFMDEEHYRKVTEAVDKDSRISILFEKFTELFIKGEAPKKTTYLRMF